MLSFFQSSRSLAEPIHLYEVVYGSGVANKVFLTDSESPVVFAGDTYAVSTIKHSEINSSGSLDKSSVEVRTPFNSPLTELFRTGPPDSVVEVSIYRGDRNDPDAQFLRLWSGRVLGFSVEVDETKLTCEPIGTSTRRPGLRRNFQYGCPHVLYSAQCQANKTAATVTAAVQNLDGMTVKLPGGWFGALDPALFHGGLVSWVTGTGNTVNRTILLVSDGLGVSTDLLLNGIPTDLAIGSTVSVSLGCDHKLSGCRMHGNVNNFGGCPWIPLVNPISNVNSFY
jgi:hypothetical protein